MLATTSKYSQFEINIRCYYVTIHLRVNLTWAVTTVLMVMKLYVALRAQSS